ncbi:hypothetical protein [Salmonirosea aquatica]|uniref:Uncharacterized protein n=1 Tax=Salmonirosea aquatica TaxID=2654236 RepID=A0A7C9F2C1_9BACT|nr:hypothetical protein [Cytophagaceae bacterium SJW1-29]
MKRKMKKIPYIICLTILPYLARAQSEHMAFFDQEMIKICLALLSTGVLLLFILEVVKQFFDYRLKNKILELRVPEEVANAILKPKTGRSSMKWVSVFTALGIGLTLVHFARPLGIHSAAILAFSTAAGFLVFFYYLRKSAH